jgi:hypothetical protein
MGWGCSSVVEHLSSIYEISSTTKRKEGKEGRMEGRQAGRKK